jgi:hypothetical protein
MVSNKTRSVGEIFSANKEIYFYASINLIFVLTKTFNWFIFLYS